jgi:hypothetical protein
MSIDNSSPGHRWSIIKTDSEEALSKFEDNLKAAARRRGTPTLLPTSVFRMAFK